MFVVSTIKGINLVFNDLNDLHTHVRNLQEYYEGCVNANDKNPPVYGFYPSDADPNVCAAITKSIQMMFSTEPEEPVTFKSTKTGDYIQ